jgi:signal transduction histidine kinase
VTPVGANAAAKPGRRALVDAGLAAMFAAVGLIGLLSEPVGGDLRVTRAADLGGVLLVLAITLPLAVRRAHPIGVLAVSGCALVVAAVAGYATTVGSTVVLVEIGSAAYFTSRRATLWIGAVAVVGVALALALSAVTITFGLVASNVFSLVLALLIGDLLREVRQRDEALHERDVARAAARRVLAATNAERRRITHDLHDGAQQQLVNAVINLQLAQRRWDDDPDAAERLVGVGLDALHAGIASLRELAAGIHPAILTSHGLTAAVAALADALPLPVEFDADLSQRLPPAMEANLYFFVSEALTNVVKHAHARSIDVHMHEGNGTVSVVVRDDGVGGAGAVTALRDRIAVLDGALAIESPVGGGTAVRARVPIQAEK